jgi:hypothetical protein
MEAKYGETMMRGEVIPTIQRGTKENSGEIAE